MQSPRPLPTSRRKPTKILVISPTELPHDKQNTITAYEMSRLPCYRLTNNIRAFGEHWSACSRSVVLPSIETEYGESEA